MDESDFLVRLEFRICGEIRERGPLTLRGLWCDGLELLGEEEFHERTAVAGNAYMMDGPKGLPGDGRWTFHLILPQGVSRSDIADWAPFLPPNDAHGWLEAELEDLSLTVWLSRW